MRLTTVGTGTAAPDPERVQAGHLVEGGGVRLLLDCGSGIVHRMASLGVDWRTITHVAITHFHPDHIADLATLCIAWRWGQLPARSEPVTILGPSGTRGLVERFEALADTSFAGLGYPLAVREVEPHEAVELGGGVRLEARPVPHTPESVAYSIGLDGRRITYTGDTGFDAGLGRWAEGSDVLLAECSLPEVMAVPSHLTPERCGELAAIARPRHLVLTHFYPPVLQEDIPAIVGRHHAGPVTVARDGWSLEI